ncbi:MAG: TolC family protein [Pseudomonadales bacterium]
MTIGMNVLNKRKHRVVRDLFFSTIILLSGCAGYQTVPLPDDAVLPGSLNSFSHERSELPLIDVRDGVDMNEVSIVSIVTNPDLIAARKREGVAKAQLFATRLLPDPQISIGVDHPTSDNPGLSDARNASLNYDLLALLTRSPAVRAQKLAAVQVRMEIVWQEWQVAQQARWFFVRERSEALKLTLLQQAKLQFERRQSASAQALREGNITIENAGPDLTALLDAGSQWYQLQQQLNQTGHELRALLGLSPDAPLLLDKLPPAPSPVKQNVATIMPSVIAIRPDLLALQAGYASQEARVRRAVLRFFPALAIGLARAVDTSAVYTSGMVLSLDLPLFAGNRGELRIERATRDQLWSEYQARITQTRSDISRLINEQRILDQRRQFIHGHIPELEQMVVGARRAYASRDIDTLVYLNLEFALINKKIELIDLEQALWEISIALDTITAKELRM